ncbi:MAG: response regulator, partial [Gammaproteobacteria bacterium]|nr:response regulator [Gammaproteobacteria bacterium]
DAVLMDLQMPVMDGFEAARRIRNLPGVGQLPIIAMTAHAMDKEREKCEEAGMNAHVSKPMEVDRLLSELSYWLGITAAEAPAVEKVLQPDQVDVLPNWVPGIVLAEGLARVMGNQALYKRLLVGFPAQYGSVLDTIREAIYAGDPIEAVKAAHALAGSAGNLSMSSLRKAAKVLQQVLETGETAGEALTLVEVRFKEVVESIQGLDLALPGAGVDSPSEQLEQERPGEGVTWDITPMLRELAAMLASHDMGAEKMFGRIMESVADAAAIEALGPVGERIEQMDYMEAGRLLAQF